jgi:mercuric ion binding protein
MNRYAIPLIALLVLGSINAQAAGTHYEMQVDGLACPFCAYSIEKKFKEVAGVEKVNVELEAGKVTVDVDEGTELTEPQVIKLFKDAGFTYRGMQSRPL